MLPGFVRRASGLSLQPSSNAGNQFGHMQASVQETGVSVHVQSAFSSAPGHRLGLQSRKVLSGQERQTAGRSWVIAVIQVHAWLPAATAPFDAGHKCREKTPMPTLRWARGQLRLPTPCLHNSFPGCNLEAAKEGVEAGEKESFATQRQN